MGSLAKSSLLHIFGKLLGVLFGLATFSLMLRIFHPEGYGIFSTALTYVTFFSIVVDFGLTITTAQMIAEKGADEERILGNLFGLRILSAGVFMSLAPLLFFLFAKNEQELLPLIIAASLTYFFGSLGQMLLGVFQKRLSLGIPVFAEMLNRALSLGGIILVGAYHPSLLLATLAFTIGSLAQCSVMFLYARTITPLRPRCEISLWRSIIYRSWPIAISIFFNLLYLKGDILFLWILGRTSEEIGQYAAAYKVVEILTMVPMTFMGLLLPLLSRLWSEGDTTRFTQYLQKTFDLFIFLGLPLLFGGWILGPKLMLVLKSDLFLAGELLHVLVPAAVCVFFGTLFGHVVVAVQEQHRMTWCYIAVALGALFGYVWLIPTYGAWGASLVTLLSEFSIALLALVTIRRSWKEKFSLRVIFPALRASIFMSLILLAGQYFFPTAILPLFFFGIASYAIALGTLKQRYLGEYKKLFFANAHDL